VSSNHPAAGSREAAPSPAASRDLAQQAPSTAGALSTGTAPDECAGTSLRLQVLEIIDSLLNSDGPELEEHRVRLRGHVNEHPWDPETALLRYLRDREQPLGTPPGLPGAGM
jgi:hypothetical protein